MATFKFLKPNTLRFSLSGQEFILTQDKIFEAPGENAYIRDLEAQGYLEELKQPELPAEAKKPEPTTKQQRSFKKR